MRITIECAKCGYITILESDYEIKHVMCFRCGLKYKKEKNDKNDSTKRGSKIK